jgi:hypothetical protein
MAIVILGGLVTTTLLDLFVFPALYLRYGAGREPDLELVPVAQVTQARMLGGIAEVSGMSAGK